MRHMIALLWLVLAGFSFAALLRDVDVTGIYAAVAWCAWLLGLSTVLVVAEKVR